MTNKGLTQSVNEPITFLIVLDIFEFCSANLKVNGSVDLLTDKPNKAVLLSLTFLATVNC